MPGIGIRYVLGSLKSPEEMRRSCALPHNDVFQVWFPRSLFQVSSCLPYTWPSLLRIPTRMSHLHVILNFHCKPPRGRNHIHLSVKPNVHIWQRTNSKKDHRQYVRLSFVCLSDIRVYLRHNYFPGSLSPIKARALLTRVRGDIIHYRNTKFYHQLFSGKGVLLAALEVEGLVGKTESFVSSYCISDVAAAPWFKMNGIISSNGNRTYCREWQKFSRFQHFSPISFPSQKAACCSSECQQCPAEDGWSGSRDLGRVMFLSSMLIPDHGSPQSFKFNWSVFQLLCGKIYTNI